ncbi:MAG: non-canonical purine NTP pyrophosphatase [Flavobacteriaceae bacterium]|nr:MAG: non-canonical purine NTP pyrophosphatase [Flavobacteriaceae bacterium]
MKIVFATNNPNKLEEAQELLPFFHVVGLKDIGCDEDIPETENTLEGNAKLKAAFVKEKFGVNCFSDDTGLEIETLNGAPGVYSARYAGEPANAEKNMLKLLSDLKNETNRKAQFRTVIALDFEGELLTFEGVCKGHITENKIGEKGFGYDPIFVPEGFNKTFAEMSLAQKSAISHRGKAIKKLVTFLHSLRF